MLSNKSVGLNSSRHDMSHALQPASTELNGFFFLSGTGSVGEAYSCNGAKSLPIRVRVSRSRRCLRSATCCLGYAVLNAIRHVITKTQHSCHTSQSHFCPRKQFYPRDAVLAQHLVHIKPQVRVCLVPYAWPQFERIDTKFGTRHP